MPLFRDKADMFDPFRIWSGGLMKSEAKILESEPSLNCAAVNKDCSVQIRDKGILIIERNENVGFTFKFRNYSLKSDWIFIAQTKHLQNFVLLSHFVKSIAYFLIFCS